MEIRPKTTKPPTRNAQIDSNTLLLIVPPMVTDCHEVYPTTKETAPRIYTGPSFSEMHLLEVLESIGKAIYTEYMIQSSTR